MTLKPRDRVTVLATIGHGTHLCTVMQIYEGGWFRARGADNGLVFARKLDEEDLDWARGWNSKGAVALRALDALESSR